MRLAIADPPYLGRAALWYGGKGRSTRGPAGRVCGRGTIDLILPFACQLEARMAIWHVTNAIPDGARVRNAWEAVIYKVPATRRAVGTGIRVPDMLSAPHPVSGFVGSKPRAWTNWVLDLLGYDPDTDTVDDLFPGSGAIAAHAARLI